MVKNMNFLDAAWRKHETEDSRGELPNMPEKSMDFYFLKRVFCGTGRGKDMTNLFSGEN